MNYEALVISLRTDTNVAHLPTSGVMTLLRNEGKCQEREIATELLARDESQIEYYTRITNNMVGCHSRDSSCLFHGLFCRCAF